MKKPPIYKVIDLFGNETVMFADNKRVAPSTLFEYDRFVEKFTPKKTTDDCYTPDHVYNAIFDYVKRAYSLPDDTKIIRPFYPDGDYTAIDYPENCVVLDNPPFSIITEIARFYIKNSIKFFLFAPHLTLFSGNLDCTHIVVGAEIEYDNGAKINTSFISNLPDKNLRIVGDPELLQVITEAQDSRKAQLPKYEYPDNVITVSRIAKCVSSGIKVEFYKNELIHCDKLDSQKVHKKTIFGAGYLCSTQAGIKQKEAIKRAKEAVKKSDKNPIFWQLSDREKQIISELDKKGL